VRVDPEVLWNLVVSALWAPETYLKFLIVALTFPLWRPLARALLAELVPALNSPADPAQVPRRAPGEDPFLNVPLASFRAQQARARRAAPRR
jgi:hypothetical protein